MNTVIPVWLKDYNLELYSYFVDAESNNKKLDNNLWTPIFNDLAVELNTYKDFNRQSELATLLTSIYSYLSMGYIFGEDLSLESSLQFSQIYTIGGLTTNKPPFSTIEDANTAIFKIKDYAIGWESLKLKDLCTSLRVAHEHVHVRGFFENLTPVATISKEFLANKILNSLGWQVVFSNLNVGRLSTPSPMQCSSFTLTEK